MGYESPGRNTNVMLASRGTAKGFANEKEPRMHEIKQKGIFNIPESGRTS